MTVKGVCLDGQITAISASMPKGAYHVLITFLEPVSDEDAEKTSAMIDTVINQDELSEIRATQFGISKKEYEILKLVQKGFSNSQIAKELEIGTGTVRNYVSSLIHKMNASNRTMLVNLAIEKGLLIP